MTRDELKSYRDLYLTWEEEELEAARAAGKRFAVLDVCHCPALPADPGAQREVLDFVTSWSERGRRQRAERLRLLRKEIDRAQRLADFLHSKGESKAAVTQDERAAGMRVTLREAEEEEEALS